MTLFLHRLKHEFREQRWLSLFWLVALLSLPISASLWWSQPFSTIYYRNNHAEIQTLLLLVAIITLTTLTIGTMRKDELKKHSAFWNTRPIRAFTLFSSKWTYLQLIATLPAFLAMILAGYLIDRFGDVLPHAIEVLIWCCAFTTILSYSVVARAGSGFLLHAVALIGGAILTSWLFFYLNQLNGAQNTHSSPDQFRIHALILLLISAFIFVAFYFSQIKRRYQGGKLGWMFAIGALSSLFLLISPIKMSLPNPEPDKDLIATEQSNPLHYSIGTLGNANRLSLISSHALEGDIQWQPIMDLTTIAGEVNIQDLDPELAPFVRLNSHLTSTNQEPKLQISLELYDRKPINSGSSSSGSNGQKLFQNLPKKEYQLVGELLVKAFYYQEIYSAPLLNHTEQHQEALRFKFGFNDKLAKPTEFVMLLKEPRFPTLWEGSHFNRSHQFKIEHPITNRIVDDRSSHSSGSGLFGYIRGTEQYIRNFEEQSYLQKQVHEDGYDGSFEEWKKEAKAVILGPGHAVYHRVKVDLTMRLPDLAKAQELLQSKSDKSSH